MTAYAMVIVVEASDPDEAAYAEVREGCMEFVGDPWPVTTRDDYDTETCLRERPSQRSPLPLAPVRMPAPLGVEHVTPSGKVKKSEPDKDKP